MNVVSFLHYLQKNKSLPAASTIAFSGSKHYPLLFFSQIMSYLQKHNTPITLLSLVESDMSSLKAMLSISNLSGTLNYWFNDFYALPIKKQQEWITYFQAYKGPHTLLFFCNEAMHVSSLQKIDNSLVVSIADQFSLQDLSMIRFLLNDKAEKASIDTGLQVQVVSLDTLCLLNHYQLVVGKNWNLFLQEWGHVLIEPTSSLFLLSQYFFGKKSQLFFTQWSQIHTFYQPTFWPTFWADQLWRAHIYCDFMKKRQFVEAKKAQYKLPYSLVNRDWTSLQLQELQKAHDYAYAIDYRLKNGGSFIAMELFFNKFFGNEFR